MFNVILNYLFFCNWTDDTFIQSILRFNRGKLDLIIKRDFINNY